ncbi:hypothetical protein PG987_000362 [Apiospora arundinis]
MQKMHRFYEPIILFEALNFATKDTAELASHAESLDARDEQQFFHAFVYKLAHLCDYKQGGATVTSFAVLQDGHDAKTVLYKFAVNQQKVKQLEATRKYVEGLLTQVDKLIDASCGRLLLRAKIHRDVLVFNKIRILVYLKQLQAQMEDCRTIYDNNKSDENMTISAGLANIESSMRVDLGDPEMTSSSFAGEAQAVIEEIEQFQNSTAGELVAERAHESRSLPGYRGTEWDLQHTMSRLVAYTVSIRFMIRARKTWPRLFQNFKVSFVPSSRPSPRVFRQKSGTAEGIIGRMTSRPSILKKFRIFVQDLQGFDLDARIRGYYENPGIHPIVHSEILLLNWLQTVGGGIRPERFFNGWMYIGASKPTCRLCHYYVEEHPSAINVRGTHGNTYLNWRVPDVLVADGSEAIAARDAIVGGILGRIREDAFDMVKRRVPSSYKQQVHHFPCQMLSLLSTCANSST